MTDNTWTLPLDSSEASLASVGGKGLNLARLVRAGFPIPDGFLITTAAYRSFVQTNDLQPFIDQTLTGPDGWKPNMILDDGGDLTAVMHEKHPDLLADIRGTHRNRGPRP